MPLFVLFHLKICDGGQPIATLCSESLNVGLAEIFLCPIFVTHNVREAVRLGDRVVLFTFRPGRVKREFLIDLPRPRQLEDVTVAKTAREILDDLREEINKSLEAEYSHEAVR